MDWMNNGGKRGDRTDQPYSAIAVHKSSFYCSLGYCDSFMPLLVWIFFSFFSFGRGRSQFWRSIQSIMRAARQCSRIGSRGPDTIDVNLPPNCDWRPFPLRSILPECQGGILMCRILNLVYQNHTACCAFQSFPLLVASLPRPPRRPPMSMRS